MMDTALTMNVAVNPAIKDSSARKRNASTIAQATEYAKTTNVYALKDTSAKTALCTNAPKTALNKAHVIAKPELVNVTLGSSVMTAPK